MVHFEGYSTENVHRKKSASADGGMSGGSPRVRRVDTGASIFIYESSFVWVSYLQSTFFSAQKYSTVYNISSFPI